MKRESVTAGFCVCICTWVGVCMSACVDATDKKMKLARNKLSNDIAEHMAT